MYFNIITCLAVVFATVATNAAPSLPTGCEVLPAPDNGAVQTLYSAEGGVLAVFTCDPDYTVIGATILSCDNGVWSDSSPHCSSVAHCNLQTPDIRPEPVDESLLKCGELSAPRFGKLEIKIGADGLSEIATFSCVLGYYVSGPSAIHCVRGVWDGKEPACLPVDCGAPDTPANGTVEYSRTTYSMKASYHCNDCYQMEGRQERVCKRSGLWSQTAPKCVIKKSVVNCPLPVIPGDAFISNKNTLVTGGAACGDVITIRCFSRHRLIGANTATCNPDGSYAWRGRSPTCRRLRWTR